MIGVPDGCSSTETLVRTDGCRTHAENLLTGSKTSHPWHNHRGATCTVPNVQKTAKLLIVEGNIGVGKTTLARKLASEMGYKLYLEPTVENPFLGVYRYMCVMCVCLCVCVCVYAELCVCVCVCVCLLRATFP